MDVLLVLEEYLTETDIENIFAEIEFPRRVFVGIDIIYLMSCCPEQ